jgi:pyruvate dehydrogenase E1 component
MSTSTSTLPPPPAAGGSDLEVLDRIQRRVLWLATAMVQHANLVRKNTSGVKVGGHQSSSASMVSLMTALWFGSLRAQDRVSVKPHAAPVLHAINYLLGLLPRSALSTLREFGGLQSYPSRSKDPDPVDFSTGSVGIGAVAPIWSAIAHRYITDHFGGEQGSVPGRHISLVGDAELDEGAIWEAIVDPGVSRLDDLLWVVDVNRQSLDRVVPEMAIGRLRDLFSAAGWHVVTVKYGRFLRALFELRGGEALHRRIDDMSNEEYQRLLRSSGAELRERLASGTDRRALTRLLDGLDDAGVVRAVRDLAGHDLADLLDAYRSADAVSDRPTVIFAYTIKGWSLPVEGHPGNHSALLSAAEFSTLAQEMGIDLADWWPKFADGTAEARRCAEVAERLHRPPLRPSAVPEVPAALGRQHHGALSTQQAFGRFFVDLAREAPEVARRVVTVSPDVASSTSLGGWINHVGVWSLSERIDWFADDTNTLVRWRESHSGQHIELGIAEVNLVGLLGELGYTFRSHGEQLFPIGTLYDPFVTRALEPWSYGIYAGGRSILVGTPSGVTLAPEGGAHQSIITPSIGLEQPGCVSWEPAFAQDLEWCLLESIRGLAAPAGQSSYLRLSTRPLDQALAALPTDPAQLAGRRRDALAGGYRLLEADRVRCRVRGRVTLVAVGAIVPEVLAAADQLAVETGLAATVIVLTSPDLVFRTYRASRGLADGDAAILDRLFPESEAGVPIVTVLDGHPHTLAFLGAIRGAPLTALGVDDFGQSGLPSDLYDHFGINTDTIIGAALDLC